MAATRMSVQGSESVEWREKGNDWYRRVTDELSPTIQVARLQSALNAYSRALATAGDDDERSSACKNIAMANWKMAKAQSANNGTSAAISFYYKEALKHFQDARDHGMRRSRAWHDSLADCATSCWFDIRHRMEELEAEERVRDQHQLVHYIIDDDTKAREYLEMAKHYFHWSLTALGDRDFQQCLILLKECHFPLKEAQRYGRSNGIVQRECDILEEDIYIQTCVAQSSQERVNAEALLSYIIEDEEVLNIDMVWEVVDSLRSAVLLTRDRDLEMEAMALSALGKVFDKILKLKKIARPCFLKVLELANSMTHRNFTGEEWYEFARGTMERYQREEVRREEEAYNKERADVLALIKEEVDTLKKKHGTLTKLEFLKFVYTTHSPKNDAHKMAEVSGYPEQSELKKMYQRAIVHYHPDKVDVEVHGKKWKVLSEEIVKLLTGHYEVFKCADPDPYKDQ